MKKLYSFLAIFLTFNLSFTSTVFSMPPEYSGSDCLAPHSTANTQALKAIEAQISRAERVKEKILKELQAVVSQEKEVSRQISQKTNASGLRKLFGEHYKEIIEEITVQAKEKYPKTASEKNSYMGWQQAISDFITYGHITWKRGSGYSNHGMSVSGNIQYGVEGDKAWLSFYSNAAIWGDDGQDHPYSGSYSIKVYGLKELNKMAAAIEKRRELIEAKLSKVKESLKTSIQVNQKLLKISA